MTTNSEPAVQIGALIRRHRESVGMKVAQLAAHTDTSRNTITNYESGRTTPSVTDLVRIAQALGCALSDLVGDGAGSAVKFAFRAHKKIEGDPDIRVAAKKYFRAYREIETIMDARLDLRLPDESFDPDAVPAAKWIPAAAARCRDLLGIRFFGPERIALLLEGLGVRTLFFAHDGKGLDGISAIEGDMSLVMLHERTKAVERMITSAAHELGHLVLHPQLFTEAVEVATNAREFEKEAQLFARHFLVPTDDLLQVWKDERLGNLPVEHALLMLKRVFHVSYWLLYWRLCDEGLTRLKFPQLVAQTKTLLGYEGPARMEDLEPEPMKAGEVKSSTRFDSLIRSAFLQEKIGVAKVAELLQVTVGEAKDITYRWIQPDHVLVE